MEKSRREFPMLDQYVYVNTASSGLLYDSLLDWRQEHDLDFLIGGSNLKMKSLSLLMDTKKTLGRFFGCVPENIALVPNFSLGLNILLEGLDKKHRVLLLENDYPSVNWPFESRGFPLFYTKIEVEMEQRIAEIIKAEKITVFALSLVQWVNGVQIDFEFLKHLKSTYPELIIIADGTQFCGTRIFNFEGSGIDVLGASAYKWLLGGYGNGFMLFNEGIKDKFSLKTTGFNAANGDLTAGANISFSKHFEPGHLDTFNFGSLKFSLEFFTRTGVGKIEEQNRKLTQKAKNELGELGLLEEIVMSRKEHGNIFNIKGNETLFQHLTRNDVICSQRGGGIRLSFHFYNSEKDIDKIIKILKKA